MDVQIVDVYNPGSPQPHAQHVYVSLSQRNLTHLQIAMDRGYTQGLVRTCENGVILHVTVEPDKEHYGDTRTPGPGVDAITDKNVIEDALRDTVPAMSVDAAA